jgi:hypothetical protein
VTQQYILCEAASSICARSLNDKDHELGIIDLNPKTTLPKEEEIELLLCLCLIFKRKDVGSVAIFPRKQLSG